MNRRSGHNLRGKPELKGKERKGAREIPQNNRNTREESNNFRERKIGKGLPRREVQRLKSTRRQCQKKRKENMKEIEKGNRE